MIAVDSDDIDDALLARLSNDATLRHYAPDGVFMHAAPANVQRFVLVSIILAEDRAVFGARIESVVYLVQAVLLTSGSADADAAAHRIDQLLENEPLVAPGYGCIGSNREERIAYTEVDDVDPQIRWQHRGGQYRIEMAQGEPS